MRTDTLTPVQNDVTRGNLWWSHYTAAAEMVDLIMRTSSDPGWIEALAHVLQEARREQEYTADRRTLDGPGMFLKTLELGRAARRCLSEEA